MLIFFIASCSVLLIAAHKTSVREWFEGVAVALVELTLELNPVQAEGMQESGERLHEKHNTQCSAKPAREANKALRREHKQIDQNSKGDMNVRE